MKTEKRILKDYAFDICKKYGYEETGIMFERILNSKKSIVEIMECLSV